MASARPGNELVSFPARLIKHFFDEKTDAPPKARQPNRDFKKNLLSFGASIFKGSSFEFTRFNRKLL
jgi:hypothetical protein